MLRRISLDPTVCHLEILFAGRLLNHQDITSITVNIGRNGTSKPTLISS